MRGGLNPRGDLNRRGDLNSQGGLNSPGRLSFSRTAMGTGQGMEMALRSAPQR